MINFKVMPGERFENVATKAKQAAEISNEVISYLFNDIICKVNQDTNLDHLYRDYLNAFIMEWKEIGPNCPAVYSQEVQDELDSRNKAAEIKAQEQRRLWETEEKKKLEAFNEKTKGIEIEYSDKQAFEDWKAKNSDGYGACIFKFAESWAKLMQVEMAKGKKLHECAQQASFEADTEGITGFMYGAAVSILSQCWKHGEELRKWHNKDYGHEGDGVVNPAVLTIN